MLTKRSDDQRGRAKAEAVWLRYFNETLFERGLISEAERNRMTLVIDRRKGSVK